MARFKSPEAYFDALTAALQSVNPAALDRFVAALARARDEQRTVFICGNGGSSATASHMACDLAKQTMVPGQRPIRAISLTDNGALISAWANDGGFGRVFAEQLIALGRPGDVLVCISCSGNSSNIDEAIREARARGIMVLGLGGFDGGALETCSEVFVHVPSHDYGLVESAHMAIEHWIAHRLSADLEGRAADGARGPAVILDRDGVINRNIEGGVRQWADFEFLPGALDALRRLAEAGRTVVVVTNQANVGRGVFTSAQVAEVHRRMREAVLEAGGLIAGVLVCEHPPEDHCACRKPAPDLLLQAAREFGFPIAEAVFIGDHQSDIEAARAAGAGAIFVRSGRGVLTAGDVQPDFVAEDLQEAVSHVLQDQRAPVDVHERAGTG